MTSLGAVAVIAVVAGFTPAHADDVLLPDVLKSLLDVHCVACHEGTRPKGAFDLAAPLAAGKMDAHLVRALRKRLVKRDMPPADELERPSTDEYRDAVAAIDAVVAPVAREVALIRRLNRAQYAGAVRDVFGDVDPELEATIAGLLPRDEIGEGFDTTADTLVLPPLLLERFFTAAEDLAHRFVPESGPAAPITVSPEQLARRGQGHTRDGFAWLWSAGALSASFDVMRAGRHRITIEVAAQQAGSDVARAAILIDGVAVGDHAVAATPDKPEQLVWEGALAAGAHSVGVRFLNDFYDPNHPDRARRDRNLAIGTVRIEGPFDAPANTAFLVRASEIAGDGGVARRLGRVASRLGEELFRRSLSESERDALVRVAREASQLARAVGTRGAGHDREREWRDGLRALVTALLVDPRFLLRVEKPCGNGDVRRALDGFEVASRLSFFLWSSVPDDALRRAAAAGELATPEGIAREARRMLKDRRAASLSQRFATQWLGVDGLETRQLDPGIYAGVDAALLTSMRRETERLFDSVVRGTRPVRALITARETEIDAALAALYGLEPPTDGGTATRPIADARAGGVLGHASVLVATSNPTRTSPVKRGKWVLEALLDEAPPPPPPGVPQLPETVEARQGLSIRELMRMHRENPDCASCHVRMDAIGLAFERLDADGRMRELVDGAPVDDATEMPDGSILHGARGVEAMLVASTSFERSLARHLLVYALGRGTADADDALVDRLAADLVAKGDFGTLVEGIVTADAFRFRSNIRESETEQLPLAPSSVD